MARQRGLAILIVAGSLLVLLVNGTEMGAWAQAPTETYQTEPDPIAPELPKIDRNGTSSNTEKNSSNGEQPSKKNQDDLEMLDLDLKQLSQVAVKSASPTMDMEVSTVTRTASSVGKSPAAVYVITNEMIKRCGARNIPEALRLAPGVQVAQVTACSWAISIRGFNGVFANKLLVQIDGRIVYTGTFTGVYWDLQQVLLEDIDRIEIIRGPGASVWGANAVNGVINIVTKSSVDTNGIYAYSGGGSEHRSFNAVRTGGRQGDFNWRIYGMQADDGPGYLNLPGGAWDPYQFAQGGFRLDWAPTHYDTLTLQGDFLGGRQKLNAIGYGKASLDCRTTNFLGRWTHKYSEDSDWSTQIYYDNWYRFSQGQDDILQGQRTFDFDTQYHTKLSDRHDIVCGFSYRLCSLVVDTQGGAAQVVPPLNTFDDISYFIQDTIELRPDHVFFTTGIKLEHDNFTNFEYQPTVRLLWAPDDQTSIWGAISRAVRIPSVMERSLVFYGGLLRGSTSVVSEDLLAYECGIRRQATDRFYWDLAVFFNRYDNLIGASPLLPPSVATNNGYGDTYGYEVVATYEATPNWRLRGSYSFLVEDVTYADGMGFNLFPGCSPRNQCFLHSAWDLPHDTTLDMIWRYVDNLPIGIPHYLVMDMRLAWQPTDHMEVSLVGQNLLDNHHYEFYDYRFPATEVPSGVYGMVTWRH